MGSSVTAFHFSHTQGQQTVAQAKKRGRPKKDNVKRDDSGKSRGEVFDPSVIFNQPHRRVTTLALVADDKDPVQYMNEAGHPLGRLRTAGLITKTQSRAGSAFAAVMRSYARQQGIRIGSPKTGGMSEFIATGFYQWETESPDREDDPEEAARRRERVSSTYDRLHVAMGDFGYQQARRVMMILKDVCILECDGSLNDDTLGDLRLGLNAVHRVLLERRG